MANVLFAAFLLPTHLQPLFYSSEVALEPLLPPIMKQQALYFIGTEMQAQA
jgi:hypothetical protein